MAKSKNSSEKTSVTRIKASDLPAQQGRRGNKVAAKKQPAKAAKAKKPVALDADGAKQNFFKSFIAYFKGAWFELKQVRWPNRRATWSMTGALLIFTGLFVGFIVGADLLWENIFKLILGQ